MIPSLNAGKRSGTNFGGLLTWSLITFSILFFIS